MKKRWSVTGIALAAVLVGCMLVEEPLARWLRALEARGSKYETLALRRHGATEPLALVIEGVTNSVTAFREEHELRAGQVFEYQVVAPRARTWLDKRTRTLFANDFWIFFEQLGLVWWGIMGCIFLWSYDPARRKYIIVFALASIASGLLVDAIKNTVGKIRPDPFYDGEYAARFMGFLSGWRQKMPVAFPSGHATQAFVTGTFFALLYPRARVMLYTAVTFTALSRVVTGAHWLSDIYAGALLGYASTRAWFWAWEKLRPRVAEWLPAVVRERLAAWQLL